MPDDERYRRRFVAETRALAVLERHPHVVPVYAAGEDRGVLYIAMLLVESDLRAVLGESGTLAPQLVASVVGQVAAALDYAHSLGFVHRDVKPANVLVAQPGGRAHCYVSDFGIASAPEPADSTTGGLGGPRGTYAYMAPEAIEARPSRDGRGDGYSLACVAHECLCGSAFFQRASEPATMMAQLKETAPPLAGELGLVAGVDTVLARELEKDPSRRFATCSSFAEALAAELARRAASSPPRARRAGRGDRRGRRGGRDRRPRRPRRWWNVRDAAAVGQPATRAADHCARIGGCQSDRRRSERRRASGRDRHPCRAGDGDQQQGLVPRWTSAGPSSTHTPSLTGQAIREVDPSAVLVGDFTGDGRTDVLLADDGGPDPRRGR